MKLGLLAYGRFHTGGSPPGPRGLVCGGGFAAPSAGGGGAWRKPPQVRRQVRVTWPVAEHEQPLVLAVLGPQRSHLVVFGQPEMPVLAAPEKPGHPRSERREIGIGQARPEPHEQQRPHGRHGLLHDLRMLSAQQLLVRAHPQHHRLRLLPETVQVQDGLLTAAQHRLRAGLVLPSHRWAPGDLLEQPVIVGGGQDPPQVPQRLKDLQVASAEPADCLLEPAAILPVVTAPQPVGHGLGGQNELLDITGLDLGADPVPQPAGNGRTASSSHRATPFSSSPVHDAAGAPPVAPADTPAPTSTMTRPRASSPRKSSTSNPLINPPDPAHVRLARPPRTGCSAARGTPAGSRKPQAPGKG